MFIHLSTFSAYARWPVAEACLVIALGLVGTACGGEGPTAPTPSPAPAGKTILKEARVLMSTSWEINVAVEPARKEAAEAAMARAWDEVVRLESVLSDYKPDSEISRVNAEAGGAPVAVDPEVAALVARGREMCDRTEGLLDVTFRPLGLLWDYHRDPFVVPDDDAVERTRALVDCRRLEVDLEASTLRLATPGMSMGLGATAKGYAVDRASRVLRDQGFTDTLVNGGGHLLAMGGRGDGPWRLGIQHPRRPDGALLGRVAVQDRALVTSGDYQRFGVANGKRYHHILDPRTGRPAEASISVTVIADTAELADGLATALFVAGRAGMAGILSRYPGLDVLLVEPGGATWMTDGFAQALEWDPDAGALDPP